MSSPRDPRRDLRLERLNGRDGLRDAHLGEAGIVSSQVPGASAKRDSRAAYEALIDAVFTAVGAAEWLLGLRLIMAARHADKDRPPRAAAKSDAICKPGPGTRRAS